jgi:hypothetical protein
MSDVYDVVPFLPDVVPDGFKDALHKSELLTPDEQLTRHERWQGEPVDFPTAVCNIFKLHGMVTEEAIDESEAGFETKVDLAMLYLQLCDIICEDRTLACER